MVKHYKKLNKSRNLSKSRKQNKPTVMIGGDDRTTGMAQAYYTNNLSGYFAPGSNELNATGKQLAVSQGTVWPNGSMAGPNLYPMNGGNCGCNKQRKRKSMKSMKSNRSKNKNKTKKNRSKKQKK